eukprot:CAMPEP_0119495424 /NCGR_PEP_ID=MMETSP1344-20130328/19065_1 /TAXON_ID=236787 /ORGANISM="Florenciella parvula, Strain CCMP2471" /LENGTH=46 /DNA_ID= /DNA_START= /DNA_END= /DNA_ORIENTATION=
MVVALVMEIMKRVASSTSSVKRFDSESRSAMTLDLVNGSCEAKVIW